ncbi:MAG TPA: hypothetical protein VE175_13270 [Woeseiaceae bacterium]|nr:hypothetical protein [Woeseiaceae bacterium]
MGGDMEAQSQSLTITTREGRPVTNALLTLNGVTIPHTGGGLYQGQLPAVAPAGSAFDLRVSAGRASVQGTGKVPEAPVLTAPETGTLFAPTDSIDITWTSTVNPDRFVVVATWVVNDEGFSQSFPAPALSRQLKVAASNFPSGTEVIFKVFAYNFGSFTGSVVPDSRMNIRGEGPSNAVITRDVGPLQIQGGMSTRFQSVTVLDGAGQTTTDATVTVNGVAIPQTSAGFFQGELPEAVPAGSPLELVVSAGGVTVEAAGNVPEVPVLTAPATGTFFAFTDSITVTWNSATNPDRFVVWVSNFFPPASSFVVAGTARQLRIAAGAIGRGVDVEIFVSAINDGSFTGPASPDSRMIISVEDPSIAGITIDS